MSTFPSDPEPNGRPVIVPLQDEIMDTVAVEVTEAVVRAEQRLSRRHFLRRSMLVVVGVTAAASVAGALDMLYPNLSGQFGGVLDVGSKVLFPAALPEKFKLNQAGVFYLGSAKTYIVHLDRDTHYLLTGSLLESQLTEEAFVRDTDGSYWLALYQRCVHLGTPVAYRNDCTSFKCPSHGAHYACDGEFLDGPAPRSMDRFPLSFRNDHILVDTGSIIQVSMPGPGRIPRVLPIPDIPCLE